MRSLRPVLELLRERAPQSLSSVCRAAHLDEAALGTDDDGRVPALQLVELLHHASAALEEPHLGLLLGTRGDLRRFPLLGYAVAHSPTVQVGLERAAKYQRILNESLRLSLDCEGPDAWVVVRISGESARHPGARHLLEACTVTVVNTLRQLSLEPVRLRGVQFDGAAPVAPDRLQDFFKTRVDYFQPQTRIGFASSVLSSSIRGAEPKVGALLTELADQRLQELPSHRSSIAEAVRCCFLSHPEKKMTVTRVSRTLGLGARSLQRRLSDEGTTFATIADSVRREIAQKYVATPDVSLIDVATRLGFNDLSAFHHAFRRWTGTTPLHYRRSRQTATG